MKILNKSLQSSLLLLGLLIGLDNTLSASDLSSPITLTDAIEQLSELTKRVAHLEGKKGAPSLQSPIPAFNATPLNIALVTALAACLIRFWTREGDNDPVRYDWDKIKDGEELPSQLFYLFDDAGIGHFGKGSYQMAGPVDPETGKATTKFSKPVYPKGVCGWTAYSYKGIIKGLGLAWICYVALETAQEVGTKDPQAFMQVFGKKMTQYLALNDTPKWAKLGLVAMIGGFFSTTFATK